jgi:hypothetical protein
MLGPRLSSRLSMGIFCRTIALSEKEGDIVVTTETRKSPDEASGGNENGLVSLTRNRTYIYLRGG